MRRLPLLFFLLLFLFLPVFVQAQDGEEATPTPTPTDTIPIPKVHVVQAGETLSSIATLYNLTVDDLILVNSLTNPEFLFEGQELLIPGQIGDVATAVYMVQIGDTLASIAAAFNTTPEAIGQQNGLLNPQLLYGGQQLVLVSRTGSAEPRPVTGRFHLVAAGETLTLLALRYNLEPNGLAAANNLPYPTVLFPGQRLYIPGETPYQDLPDEWITVNVHPARPVQGQSLAIYVENLQEGTPDGTFAGQSLHFSPYENGYLALVGLPVDAPSGPQPLEITGSGQRPWRPFHQPLLVVANTFGRLDLTLAAELTPLLDPNVRIQDDALLDTYFSQFTPTPLWEGLFQYPLTNTLVTSNFGEFRTYNGSPLILHTGVDFFAATGTPILAPAGGTVIFNEPTPLRGNVIILDHGLGLTSGYFHLTETLVTLGQTVTAGQLIGKVGTTGLSTGAHLHWDVRVHNVPVSGQQWVEELFP
ncbi:MAG: LysM peptidoglycan-binding domain-containing protein [Chloroflexi bacterium]|nr:LysM peptidoglycan-binding domain-containing protein [Chloroflexota bacterium]MBP8058308.1 LysM peptidoglycan-binding domain-containing protein [Chloroflexota bacterium]